MKFWKTVGHAALGGLASGVAGAAGGASWKALLLAGVGSALTSIISLFAQSPKNG